MNAEIIPIAEEVDPIFADLETALILKKVDPKANPAEPGNKTLNYKTDDGAEFRISTKDAVFAEKKLPNKDKVDQRYMAILLPEDICYEQINFKTLHLRNYSLDQNNNGDISVKPGFMIWATGADGTGKKVNFFYNSLSNGVFPEKRKTAEELLKVMTDLVAELSLKQ